jgi:hypothetical protein
MSTTENTTIMINGVEYKISDLSDNAKNQIINLRVTDQEIASLNQKLAIAQTARAAYANALAAEINAPNADAAKQ